MSDNAHSCTIKLCASDIWKMAPAVIRTYRAQHLKDLRTKLNEYETETLKRGVPFLKWGRVTRRRTKGERIKACKADNKNMFSSEYQSCFNWGSRNLKRAVRMLQAAKLGVTEFYVSDDVFADMRNCYKIDQDKKLKS